MFDITTIDRPDIRGLLAGSNVMTGFNVRLDIFTPVKPLELSSLLDREYEKAEALANEVAKDEKLNEAYRNRSRFISHYNPPPLSPREDFLEGENGPPLGKARLVEGFHLHDILKTFGERDYGYPSGGYAYSMVRRSLTFCQGEVYIVPRDNRFCVIDDSIHNRFDFRAESDMCLLSFVLGMIDLYGKYTPEALEAKMMFAAPTVEEGKAQRDALQKLSVFFHNNSIPFYVTLHNHNNRHTEIAYGINSDGRAYVRQLEKE